MSSDGQARWWSLRRAQNRKPATYRCPLCDGYLPALSEHVLLLPEGDARRRRHAHMECVLKARMAGELPTREEFARAENAAQTAGPAPAGPAQAPSQGSGVLRGLLGRLARLSRTE